MSSVTFSKLFIEPYSLYPYLEKGMNAYLSPLI